MLPGIQIIPFLFSTGLTLDFFVFDWQPIIPINYSSYKIPIKLPVSGLYSANTAQIYPEDRGTNYSVELGEKVTKIILEDANGFIER